MVSQAFPEYRVIPLALIDEPALPSRTDMDELKMDELVEAIRSDGFQSVIGVVAIGDRFEIVYGHRRSIAARRVGLAALPCFVYASKDTSTMRFQYRENYIREDISATDEAILFQELLEETPDAGTDGVAARLGQTRNYVEGRIALFRGCPQVFEALKEKTINIGVASELNKCTEDAHRRMLLDMAVRGGATVSLVRGWISEWKAQYAPASGATPPAPAPGGPSPLLMDDYFICRVCGERHNTPSMRPVNVHDYCLQQIIDPRSGLVRSRTDYVLFPATREAAAALVDRLLERFPELTDDSAAPA